MQHDFKTRPLDHNALEASITLKLKQRINRMQLLLNEQATKERKRDAREKIQLGGLIVKAGLRDCDKAVILGALLELSSLGRDTPAWRKLKERGAIALKETST